MKKSTINTASIFTAILMLTILFPMRSHAQEGNEAKFQFLSDIGIETVSYAVSSCKWLKENNYTKIDIDLNKGVRNSDYVYMGYKLTNDPYDAITDIIIVQFIPEKVREWETIVYNGRTYRPANFSPDSKGGNLNRGKEGADNIYLYYTKDRKAEDIVEGDVAAMIPVIIVSNGSYKPSDIYARLVVRGGDSYPNADLNKGAGGKYIYLEKKFHVHKQYGGMDKDGLIHCECGVVLKKYSDVPQLSEDGYYNIHNIGQLSWFVDFVNSNYENHEANARLLNNLDVSVFSQPLPPLGSGSEYHTTSTKMSGGVEGNGWSGTFDGNGYKISNFKITLSNGTPAGFVAYGKNCTVKNLTLDNANIQNLYGKDSGSRSYGVKDCAAGVIACIIEGATIHNCTVNGVIGNGDNRVAAGIATSLSDVTVDINGCVNNAEIKAQDLAAGIYMVSNNPVRAEIKMPKVSISRCINNGNITCMTYAITSIAAISFCPAKASDNLNTGKVKRLPESQVEAMFDTEMMRGSTHLYNNLSIGDVKVYHKPKNIADVDQHGNIQSTEVSPTRMKDGSICYELNDASVLPDVAWRQELGKDAYPTPEARPFIVYKYNRYNDEGTEYNAAYTNHRAFADDMNDAPCYYRTRSFELANADSTEAKVTLQCIVCNNVLNDQPAKLVAKHQIVAPTCDHSGLIRHIYKVEDEDATVTHDFEMQPLSTGSHGHFVRNEVLGVDQCERCGAVKSDAFEPCKFVDGVAQISKPGHLFYYAKQIEYTPGDAKLLCDIDLSNVLPYLGNSSIPVIIKDFKNSTFDGDGHVISGFVTLNKGGYSSLFGYMSDGSVVKNLTVEGNVVANRDASLLVRTLREDSKIENCITRGSVRGDNGVAGGLCCYIDKSDIEACRNYADVTANDGSFAGGIVATINQEVTKTINITRCANYGTVSGDEKVGGIMGSAAINILMRDCANYGRVIASTRVGGLIGDVKTSSSGDNLSALYNINVGRVTIYSENDTKGSVCGDVDVFDNQHLELSDVYYLHDSYPVGTLTRGKLGTSNVMLASQDEFSDGTICDVLNRIDEKFFKEFDPEYDKNAEGQVDEEREMAYVNSHKAVWGMESVNGVLYPSPFSNKKIYKLSYSDTRMYILEGQELNKLNILDGFYFNAPVVFTVNDLTYEAPDITVKKDKYATLRLPFNYSDSRLKILEYTGCDAAKGEVYFNPVAEAQAEKNYLVRLADDCTDSELQLNIVAQQAGIAVSTSDFPKFTSDIPDMETGYYGTYAKKTLSGSDGFYLLSASGDTFQCADSEDGGLLSPFRAIFKYEVADPTHTTLRIVEDKSPSGILSIEHISPSTPSAIYNVGGQRVNTLQRGINIIRTREGKSYKVM